MAERRPPDTPSLDGSAFSRPEPADAALDNRARALADAVPDPLEDALRGFLTASEFSTRGAVVTDLDGTAVHEFEGRIVIPEAVSHGLKALSARGRPVILNTLRFPLNVIRTFGRAWNAVTDAPLPLVSLNGGIVGYLRPPGEAGDAADAAAAETSPDDVVFEEILAFPLDAAEIDGAVESVRRMLADGFDDVVLFHYPRDWRQGEIIWTPKPEAVPRLEEKYRSASEVVSTDLATLRDRLHAAEPCMMLLLVDAPEDRLMAYQHSRRSNFLTRSGIDKLTGLRALADRLDLDLAHALGAGDTPMDSFLAGVGLSVQVGPQNLDYRGLTASVRVRDSLELGSLFFRLAELHDELKGSFPR